MEVQTQTQYLIVFAKNHTQLFLPPHNCICQTKKREIIIDVFSIITLYCGKNNLVPLESLGEGTTIEGKEEIRKEYVLDTISAADGV
jgi:hypothetical protein